MCQNSIDEAATMIRIYVEINCEKTLILVISAFLLVRGSAIAKYFAGRKPRIFMLYFIKIPSKD